MQIDKIKNKKILITGGLGFLGSNLALKLHELGADITIIDSMSPDYGANLYNIESIKDDIKIIIADITDTKTNLVSDLVVDQDYIFHLAAQVSHTMSLTDPFPDIDINVKGTALLLEYCKKLNPDVKIIYTGTRGQYGTVLDLPAKESQPMNPKGIYEMTKMAAEMILRIYYQNYKIRSVMTRISNVYGPRAQMKTDKYGVVNWFIRKIIDGEKIKIFGNGNIKRDVLFIDDCIEALILLAIDDNTNGEVYNIGDDKGYSFKEIAQKIIEANKSGDFEYTEFEFERKVQEPGDFFADISKIYNAVGWKPKTSFEDGLDETIRFYKENKKHYW